VPRSHLGCHHGFRPGQLHQLEAATLVLRAGRMAGMIVRAEHRLHVVSPGGRQRSGEIDICWFHPITNRFVVAWEIDGQDPPDEHILGGGPKDLTGNKAKFHACGADIKVQVLYSLKNDISSKGRSKRQQINGWLSEVDVVTDEELMAPSPEGIDTWIRRLSVSQP
jgi:hypothetical protein